jgi:hypothetical protein
MNLRQQKQTSQEENSADINVSAKALRMGRYREKLNNERQEKYNEMRQKDAERKRTDRKLESQIRNTIEKAAERQREIWRNKKTTTKSQEKTEKC